VCAGVEALSGAQLDLAAHAFAMLDLDGEREDDEDEDGDGEGQGEGQGNRDSAADGRSPADRPHHHPGRDEAHG
jgi:hypothetical protein